MSAFRAFMSKTGLILLALCAQAHAAGPPAGPAYDEALAKSVGADERGMRSYVLVILKTGPNRVPAGRDRDEMFKGHFANIDRLAADGTLVLAGPLDGVDGWRGLFVLAVADIEEARRHVATDPVVIQGEMVAEYHKYYGSAALMLVPQAHRKVDRTR
ncbi:YciI family protein [Piscinibacter sp. XHJ-5]|uniref:YciI family protein n=1 Tax=Piscinibacter sp. XHJ-5 TaxID=3037797 RepID=UPI002453540A|nr:YciI family protein [Piscinibacter sp. XHJ-5]